MKPHVDNNAQWWLLDLINKNAKKPLKILFWFVFWVAFCWFFIDYPNFNGYHLIEISIISAGMLWFYLVKAKEKR